MLFFPDSLKDDESAAPKPQAPQLPKVTVTSSTADIRRAFKSVSGPSTPLGSVDASGGGSSGGSSGSGSSGGAGGGDGGSSGGGSSSS
jgi:hypothetical protein